MIAICKTTIDRQDVDNFLQYLDKNGLLEDEEWTLEKVSSILHSISAKANWDIDSILLDESMSQIEYWKIRDEFRCFLIAEKFNIKKAGSAGNNEYYISYVDDYCVLVNAPGYKSDQENSQRSTIILSPQGKINIPEGQVRILENLIFFPQHWFLARWTVLEGSIEKSKIGLYNYTGDVIIPCILDAVDLHDGEYNGYVFYKRFRYWIFIKSIAFAMNNNNPRIQTYKLSDEVCLEIVFRGHEDGIVFFNDGISRTIDDDPYTQLSPEEQWRLGQENMEEFYGIMGSIHPLCYPKAETSK